MPADNAEERRWEVERRSDRHCQDHSGNIVKIDTIAAQVSDLYEKHEETRDLLSEIKLCMENMNSNMQGGFLRQDKAIRDLTKAFESRVEYSDSVLAKYEDVVKGINKKFQELDDFRWFRDWMNSLRDRMPKYALLVIVLLIGVFATLHWSDIGKLLIKKVGG